MIKAIFFDAAGTLFRLRRSVGENYAALAQQQQVDLPADVWESAFLQAWRTAPFRRTTSRPRDDDDKMWWCQLVASMLREISSLPATFEADRFFEAAYAHFAEPSVWTVYDDVPEALVTLQPRYQLNVVSNFDRRLHPILHGLGLARFFTHVFISSELGVDKPSPQIYRAAVARAGVAPFESLHVGDDPARDWEAAENAGLEVFRLNRARNSLRDLCLQLGNTR